MSRYPLNRSSVEVLEARIAPAAIIDGVFKAGQVGTRIALSAGEGLSTGGDQGGAYMLFVEEGKCIVFTTDLNNNGQLDFNEITGISAGDGLRLISFADIYGDIVTNLKDTGFLSDSDNNAANDPPALAGDGRVLLNSTIEKIELRSLTASDIRDVNGDGIVDDSDLATRLVLSSYSIHGNIYAGAGFGAVDGGLLIDTTGFTLQSTVFGDASGGDLFIADTKPTVGSIKVGTAVGDDYYSFGASRANDTQGFMVPFVPQPGVPGGSIQNIRAAAPDTVFNITSLEAGSGGVGSRGGDVFNVTLNSDDAGGFDIIAGNGGNGPNGGDGGSVRAVGATGSITSAVTIRSGNGGTGLTGTGGNGGAIEFGDFDVSGNVRILLGNGGTGFIRGGNGASFPVGVITSPSGPDAQPNQAVGTWHNRLTPEESIGTHSAIDFNNDGNSDYVFTSQFPGQLVVSFGDGLGGFLTTVDENGQPIFDRIYLDGFASSQALTVGDFNNDGHEDIATGSSETASFGGVRVFLSIYRDLDGDGVAETFSGFTRGIESPLPALFAVNPGPLPQANYRSAVPISDMAAGDFNGDGVTDIAVTATYRDAPSTREFTYLIIMTGDAEAPGVGTGSFYADFGTAETTPPLPGPLFPFAPIGFRNTASIEATSITTTSDHDVVALSFFDSRNILIFDAVPDPALAGFLTQTYEISAGRVDTNRNPEDVNFADAHVQEFTVVDSNSDGVIDFAAVLNDPNGFMISIRGDGTDPLAVVFAIDSGNGVDQAGIRLGQNGFNIGETYVGIRNYDFDGDGIFDEVALLNYTFDNRYFDVDFLSIETGPDGATFLGFVSSTVNSGGRTNEVAWDVWPLTTPPPSAVSFIVGVNPTDLRIAFNESTLSFDFLTEFGLQIAAGDGGSSLIGVGGTGGSLGGRLGAGVVNPLNPLITDPTGDLDITYPENLNQGSLFGSTLVAGNGGNGFTRGGDGGIVSGVSARETGNAGGDDVISVFAGNGGFAVAGPGGDGGDVFAITLQRGILVQSGIGGDGRVGGNGGSITGNGVRNAYDTQTAALTLIAGAGGIGTKRGGNGGGIASFVSQFPEVTSGAVPGPFIMMAGDGGSAISGKGGTGGSITDASPRFDENALALEIYARAGNGGNGVKGGPGGSISNFVNRPTTLDVPTLLTFIAGNGGSGTTGKGGRGGNIVNVASPSTAEGFGIVEPFTYDRIIAGNGGASSSKAGGPGGSVIGLDVSASSGAIAVVAGAGGVGLQRGGNGGSVLSSAVASGGPDTGGKVLVIGGAGGDATAFTTNPNEPPGSSDPVAFGGKVGRGGKGGNVLNFTQSNSIDVSVDIIAGNGGSTLNYGTSFDTKSFVGKGGSISNLNITGSIGNIAPDVPIRAYNDLDGDGTTDVTVAEFVQSVLLQDPLASLNDLLGNVGIVTGAAGRIKAIQVQGGGFESQPAPNAAQLNGSVKNVTARLLMSAIAGDVNAIAAIHGAQNINVPPEGVVGADKNPVGSTPDYLDASGAPTSTPVLGGRLIDGAFISDNRVPEIDGRPRVFVL